MTSALRFFLFLSMCAFPNGGLAQAFVQAGEHENFTRVVTQLPDDASWMAEQDGRRVTVRLDDFGEGFSTDRVFDLIPRDRLSSVTSSANALELELACDCRVTAFDVAGNYMALDILTPGREGTRELLPLVADVPNPPTEIGALEAAETLEPVDLPQVVTMTAGLRQPEPDRLPIQTEVIAVPIPTPSALPVPNLLATGLPTPNAPDLPQIPAIAPPVRAKPFPLEREALTPEARQLLAEIQKRLAQEVSTAATIGVLEPRGPSALPDMSRAQIDTRVFADDLAASDGSLAASADQRSNIRISSSMDLPQGLRSLQEQVSVSGVVCPAPETFDLMGWADNRPFHTQIGPLRRDLYGEFDRLDEMKAVDLTKTYLYFGFGAEARQVLGLDAALAKREHLLMSMAEIFERGQAQADAPLRALTDCGGDTALWAVMAHDAIPSDGVFDPDDAILALNRLPVHLRQTVAPMLSEKLLAYGDRQAAQAAMRSIERLPDPLTPDAMLAQARLTLDGGEIEEGKEQLREVIAAGSDPSPEALILLVEEKIAADQEVDAMTAALVEAYTAELGDTELGADLRRTHVFALMKSGQFDRAFEAVDRLARADEGLRHFMLRELVEAAPDVVFLEHYFAQEETEIASLPRRDVLAFGSRLLELGFAQSARSVVGTLPNRPVHSPSRLLAARISLALEQPSEAQAALENIEGPQADVLRAEALRQGGAHAEAHDLFRRTDRSWDATQSAWLADDWRSLTQPETPVFGPLVRLSQTVPIKQADSDGMLARSAAMLEESGKARQLIRDFLKSPELTSPTEEAVE